MDILKLAVGIGISISVAFCLSHLQSIDNKLSEIRTNTADQYRVTVTIACHELNNNEQAFQDCLEDY